MKCAEIENTDNPVKQYLKALDFLSNGSPGSHISVTPEILLYLYYILRRIWDQTRKQVDEIPLEVSSKLITRMTFVCVYVLRRFSEKRNILRVIPYFYGMELAEGHLEIGHVYTRCCKCCPRNHENPCNKPAEHHCPGATMQAAFHHLTLDDDERCTETYPGSSTSSASSLGALYG